MLMVRRMMPIKNLAKNGPVGVLKRRCRALPAYSPRDIRHSHSLYHDVDIAATTTDGGLKVRAELDEKKYPKGVKVSDLQMAAVNLTRHSFHGDWNYTISPHRKNHRPKRID
jgi:hypothetical protein